MNIGQRSQAIYSDGILPSYHKNRAMSIFNQFFHDHVNNPNTRQAYGFALQRFADWCWRKKLDICRVESSDIVGYISTYPASMATRRQHLAAIRKFYKWLCLTRQIPSDPTVSVKLSNEPKQKPRKHSATAWQARHLLNSIDISHRVGLRDRAFIGLLIFSLSKISLALNLRIGDYIKDGDQAFLRFKDAGHINLVPVHKEQMNYIDEYLAKLDETGDEEAPLFRSSDRSRNRDCLLKQFMTRKGALKMLKRRIKDAGLPEQFDSQSLRLVGINEYLRGGGDVQTAARLAGYSSVAGLFQQLGIEQTLGDEDIEKIHI